MSKHPLYQALLEQISEHVEPSVPQSSRERLVLLVMGIIVSESASPAKMAEALDEIGIGDAQVDSIERRIRRTENDPNISASLSFHPLARQYLLWGRPNHLLLAIDPTTQNDRIVMLTVSVVYRGRSLPLAWAIWAGNQPLKGLGFWERVAALLQLIATLLPVRVPVTIVADRAFGTPSFTDLVQAQGWHYIVRVQGQTHYQDRVGHDLSLRSLVTRRGQRRKLRGQVFKKQGWREASVVVYWGVQHSTPLCLVSDLPPDWTLIATYRQRYTIEALFRDYKFAGWHWEQSQVTDLEHMQRLLVGMALALWLSVMIGTQVVDDYLDRHPQPTHRTLPPIAKRSLFQHGLHRLKQWAARNCRLPLTWHLSDWNAFAWQAFYRQRLLQHTVFGLL